LRTSKSRESTTNDWAYVQEVIEDQLCLVPFESLLVYLYAYTLLFLPNHHHLSPPHPDKLTYQQFHPPSTLTAFPVIKLAPSPNR
jgi:hypothetical protein